MGASPSWVASGIVDGQSLSFNGTDDECFINVPADGIPTNGAPYTFEFWVNIDTGELESSRILIYFDYGEAPSSYNALFSAMFASGTRVYNIDYGSGYSVNDPSTTDIVGNWVHIACSYDGTDRKIYINGSLRETYTPAGPYTAASANNFAIGGSQYWANLFHGLIDDVKVYDVARTTKQIAQAVADATGQPVCSVYYKNADLDGDCFVNFVDFADFASQWLSPWTIEDIADFAADWLVDDMVDP